MKLNENQINEIKDNGYIVLPDWFSNIEVNKIRKEMKKILVLKPN